MTTANEPVEEVVVPAAEVVPAVEVETPEEPEVVEQEAVPETTPSTEPYSLSIPDFVPLDQQTRGGITLPAIGMGQRGNQISTVVLDLHEVLCHRNWCIAASTYSEVAYMVFIGCLPW